MDRFVLFAKVLSVSRDLVVCCLYTRSNVRRIPSKGEEDSQKGGGGQGGLHLFFLLLTKRKVSQYYTGLSVVPGIYTQVSFKTQKLSQACLVCWYFIR